MPALKDTLPLVVSTAVPSPQLMAALKSEVWSPGLASVNVASTTGPDAAPSVAVKAGPASARSGASDTTTVWVTVALAVPGALSVKVTTTLRVPSSAYVWLPETVNVPVPPDTVPVVVLPSPQLI